MPLIPTLYSLGITCRSCQELKDSILSVSRSCRHCLAEVFKLDKKTADWRHLVTAKVIGI
jgi:hypothetical protein